MMVGYFLLKSLHIIGATVLLGTGAGIAFFMVMAHRAGDNRVIAHTAATVVFADMLFTATAVVLQPVTGVALANWLDLPLTTHWIAWGLGLYVFAGLFWLPVVWMQWRMRDLAREAAATNAPLPPLYHRLFRWWFAFGFPAFFAVLAIIWLMVAKPT
jgi:uncharacterized membrane protein